LQKGGDILAKRKTSLSEVTSDVRLRPEDGWVNLDVKWLVDEKSFGSKYACFGRTVFAPGGKAQHQMHIHPNAEEMLYVLRGRLEYIIGGDTITVGPEEICYTPPNTPHMCRNVSTTELCEVVFVYAGAPSLEKAGYVEVKD
jgi:quercetin dioxygenase-like cupin family protein